MSDKQMLVLLNMKFRDVKFRSIKFNEGGDMLVEFWDRGGNFHEQLHHDDGTFSTIER